MNTITTTDGTQIYYRDWGSGQPVVLSHGWPLSSNASAKLVKNSTLRIYKGAPHGLTATHKKQLNDDLLSFLS